ncbi:SCO6880 family protein [Gordonia sp. CPCC 205515]|uniref:SCO6880 family protein n=1 Tax=Gordonia sp. CPCC 205515 TaxID=3140791 RepID=UPI003AF3BD8B
MADQQLAPETTYGNWSSRESTGAFGLTAKATYTVIGLTAVSFVLIRMTGNFLLGAGIVLVGMILVGAGAYRPQGLSVFDRVSDSLRFTGAKMKGETDYAAGPLTPFNGAPLPGLGANIQLHAYTAADGSEVGVLHDPKQRTVTIIWRVDPIGEENVDGDDRDRMVAFWGVFQRDLGQFGDIVFATATVDGYPSSGLMQLIALESALDDDAPAAAANLIREVEEELPTNSFDAQHRIAITFACPGDWRDRIVEISRRFYALSANIHACDMDCRILRADEITEFVRRSYDPSTQLDFDDLRARKQEHGLHWRNAGPTGAKEYRSDYAHDTATSMSYVVWEWPKDGVSDHILHPLLEVNPRVPRKRVTLLYQPETSANARSIVENQQRDAMRASQRIKRGIHDVDALNRLEAVTQSRDEVSRGAGWLAQALIVTVTVDADGDSVADVDSIVSDLATQCSLRVRPAAFHQASTFQYGLGIGLVPPIHASVTKRK